MTQDFLLSPLLSVVTKDLFTSVTTLSLQDKIGYCGSNVRNSRLRIPSYINVGSFLAQMANHRLITNKKSDLDLGK